MTSCHAFHSHHMSIMQDNTMADRCVKIKLNGRLFWLTSAISHMIMHTCFICNYEKMFLCFVNKPLLLSSWMWHVCVIEHWYLYFKIPSVCSGFLNRCLVSGGKSSLHESSLTKTSSSPPLSLHLLFNLRLWDYMVFSF